jgi:hypothetical protein
MTLPAAEQRALDGMAEAMRASELRLVSMFTMFTLLTGNEAAPGREHLPPRPLRDFVGVLAFWRHAGATGRRRSAAWRRALLAAQLAIGVGLVGLLVGMSGGNSAGVQEGLPKGRAQLGPALRPVICPWIRQRPTPPTCGSR